MILNESLNDILKNDRKKVKSHKNNTHTQKKNCELMQDEWKFDISSDDFEGMSSRAVCTQR